MEFRTIHISGRPSLLWRILWSLIALGILLVSCASLVLVPIVVGVAFVVAAVANALGLKSRPRLACTSCGTIFTPSAGEHVICPNCNTILNIRVESSETSSGPAAQNAPSDPPLLPPP